MQPVIARLFDPILLRSIASPFTRVPKSLGLTPSRSESKYATFTRVVRKGKCMDNEPSKGPNLGQISGTFPNANTSFQGVVDTIGSTQIPNVQDYLMQEYPGKTIIELPGSPRDLGVTQGIFTVPATMSCPAGTTQVP